MCKRGWGISIYQKNRQPLLLYIFGEYSALGGTAVDVLASSYLGRRPRCSGRDPYFWQKGFLTFRKGFLLFLSGSLLFGKGSVFLERDFYFLERGSYFLYICAVPGIVLATCKSETRIRSYYPPPAVMLMYTQQRSALDQKLQKQSGAADTSNC